jgi:hypothetical protein
VKVKCSLNIFLGKNLVYIQINNHGEAFDGKHVIAEVFFFWFLLSALWPSADDELQVTSESHSAFSVSKDTTL